MFHSVRTRRHFQKNKLGQYPALSPAGSKSFDCLLVYTKHIRNKPNLVVSLVNMQILFFVAYFYSPRGVKQDIAQMSNKLTEKSTS